MGQRIIRVDVNPANIAAGAVGQVDLAVPEAHRGHAVVAIPPSTLEGGIIVKSCNVEADGVVRITLFNPTAGAIDAAAAVWGLLLFDES